MPAGPQYMKSPDLSAVLRSFLLIAVSGTISCYQPVSNSSASADEKPDTSFASTGSESGKAGDRSPEVGEKKEETQLESSGGPVSGGFRANFEANLRRSGIDPASAIDGSNSVESRILEEYGAIFLTRAVPPPKVMFTSEGEVSGFQSKAGVESANLGGTNIELQPTAMAALKKASEEASAKGLSITPRDGAEAGRRTYSKTLDLWNSRFFKALDHWRSKGRLTGEQVSRLKDLPIKQQVSEVLELEKSGIFFNTFFNNSILYSVAAPGTSQHLSMLAFDATEFQNAEVRKILAANGWFRTVQNDEPHFTYLGLAEAELPGYGLKKVSKNGGEYWIPDL